MEPVWMENKRQWKRHRGSRKYKYKTRKETKKKNDIKKKKT